MTYQSKEEQIEIVQLIGIWVLRNFCPPVIPNMWDTLYTVPFWHFGWTVTCINRPNVLLMGFSTLKQYATNYAWFTGLWSLWFDWYLLYSCQVRNFYYHINMLGGEKWQASTYLRTFVKLITNEYTSIINLKISHTFYLFILLWRVYEASLYLLLLILKQLYDVHSPVSLFYYFFLSFLRS